MKSFRQVHGRGSHQYLRGGFLCEQREKVRVEDLGLSVVLVSEEGEMEREKEGKGERRYKLDRANVKLQVAYIF